jgi:hypothetical protein
VLRSFISAGRYNGRRGMQPVANRKGDEEKGRKGGKRSASSSFDSLFASDWEVFVIKRDKATGKLVGKTACCALAKVD